MVVAEVRAHNAIQIPADRYEFALGHGDAGEDEVLCRILKAATLIDVENDHDAESRQPSPPRRSRSGASRKRAALSTA